MRSCLDHIAWLLSSDQYRLDHERWIAFPTATEKPRSKDEVASYSRKVEGILSKDARGVLERLQPYNAANPADDPLAILHELDREDKHHTLVLIVPDWNMTFSFSLSVLSTFVISPFYGQEEWRNPALAAKPKLELAPYVAFAQFGQRKGEAVIPALTYLLDTVSNDVSCSPNSDTLPSSRHARIMAEGRAYASEPGSQERTTRESQDFEAVGRGRGKNAPDYAGFIPRSSAPRGAANSETLFNIEVKIRFPISLRL